MKVQPPICFSKVAVGEIIKRNPAAKMIVMMRNPVDAAYSYHSERLYNLSEYVADFEEAWSLQESRAHGQFISKYCRGPELLQYRSVFSYSSQIKRLFQLVPEGQRMIFIFEEFRMNPKQVYLAVLKFLGLQYDGREDFPAFHANKVLRSRRLAEWHHSQLAGARNWFQKLETMANLFGLPPSKVITRLNARRKPRVPLAPRLRRQLTREFTPDVRELEQLLRRRLDCWVDFDS